VYSQRQTSATRSSFFGRRPEGAEGLLHDAIFGPCAAAFFVLDRGKPEEQKPGQAELRRLFHFFHGFVDGEVVDPRHGADFAPDAFSRANEEGVDQCSRLEMNFADQRTHRFGTP
jgi:hypothetical protein